MGKKRPFEWCWSTLHLAEGEWGWLDVRAVPCGVTCGGRCAPLAVR